MALTIFKPGGINEVTDPSSIGEGYSPILINVDAHDDDGVSQRASSPYSGIPAEGLNCIYNGRTYSANGRQVIFDKGIGNKGVLDYGNIAAELESDINMLVDLVDGILVGSNDEVVFLGPGDPVIAPLPFRQVHRHGVARGSCCKVDNTDLGIDTTGYSVIFKAHDGICIAGAGGAVTNYTAGKVAIPECNYAPAVLRTTDNMVHYVLLLQGQAAAPDKFTPMSPTDT